MNTQAPRDPREKYEQEMRDYKSGLEVGKSSLSPRDQELMRNVSAERAYKNAANNFYWIAGLSIVNSVSIMTGSNFHFVMGLGITQLVDVLAYYLGRDNPDGAATIKVVGLVISAVICGLIALLGYLTSRRKDWPVVAGMILYSLDSLLMLVFQDWVGLAFHIFFLFQISAAYRVIRLWKKSSVQQVDSFPQNIGVS